MAETPRPHTARDGHGVLEAAREWLDKDGAVAMATVVDTWGSAPVPIGGQMAVAKDGRFQGSVSGGCIEGDVIAEAEEIMATGKPRLLEFGVADETAWRAGLPCGGKVKVYVERIEAEGGGAELVAKAVEAQQQRHGLVIETRLADGAKKVFAREDKGVPDDIAQRFSTAKSQLKETPDGDVFLHALVPPARIVVVGASHIGQVLAEISKLAGYEVQVVDPRSAFAAPERFPGITIHAEWPQDVLPRIGLDPYTAVVALAHVGHIDDEALKLALKSDCLYVGALGSSRNHAKRRERLLAAGITEEELARIRAPIGIDIGAQTPAEIAVSVMAEIIRAVRGPKRKG
ncbi:MAG: XdhC family protein [Hyphomicrobiaceae bacterium]|nr:XdhC family protein [Hyphomicrobiaceae bacterium]